jgi:hypothetical protein
LGLWLIAHFLGFQHKLAKWFSALLIGIAFFEGSLIGMLIDPRSTSAGWPSILITAALTGLGAAIAALIFTPIYLGLIKIFKH